jgi:hypothetical protein
LWSRLTLLLDTASEAVSGCGYPVSSQAVEIGDLAWSDCCDEGHLYIRVVRMNAVSPFPQATLAPSNCALEMSALVELGILRCVGNLEDGSGYAVSPAERTLDSLQNARDASILFNVLKSATPDWANHPLVIEQWVPLGPQGGCAGGAWQFHMDVALCECGHVDEDAV